MYKLKCVLESLDKKNWTIIRIDYLTEEDKKGYLDSSNLQGKKLIIEEEQ